MTILAQMLRFDRVVSVTDCDGDGMHTQHNGTLEEILEKELTLRYGPLLAGDALRQVLGYTSSDAFRQALSRKTIPIPVFSIPNRRGKFALVKDAASWLASQREAAAQKMEKH